ncbi:hypothetical protein KXD96_03410 [Mycobacterium sp. SMC-2]|uniref:hypothetical protein n=1 Tax=Mycobacterium sp. SMC-2 TaxID=2857058 RepID=UPI0021B23526|nr:hypothetical protein [Mycobacterium sp. SMC-2]UXA07220.1 hypothetical protein KXD96_03410 [Mycobacterium sp. SMC-2]
MECGYGNDRGQRRNDTAKLSTFELVEKYLIWDWSATAYGPVGTPSLWPRLYSRGFSPDVEVVPIAEGIAELQSKAGKAVLMEPKATIFSHLINKSVEEIELIVMKGAE